MSKTLNQQKIQLYTDFSVLVILKEDYIYKNNNAFCFNVNWKLFTPQLYRI